MALEVESLQKRLGTGNTVFENVTFSLDQGIAFVTGPSGIGKSTLLKCIAQLSPTTSGKVRLHGRSPHGMGIPLWRSRVLYVPQHPPRFPGTPNDLWNDITSLHVQKHRDLEHPRGIAERWEISRGLWDKRCSTLSGGELQRVFLAIALATRPEVLLLDEPTSSLDNQATQLVEKDLLNWRCLWITHDLSQVSRLHTQHPNLIQAFTITPNGEFTRSNVGGSGPSAEMRTGSGLGLGSGDTVCTVDVDEAGQGEKD